MRIFQILVFLLLFGHISAQTIPYGSSVDSVELIGDYKGPYTHLDWTLDFQNPHREVYYYKPATYNPQTSPILWYWHGSGGTGASSGQLHDIADRRGCIIVAPTGNYPVMQAGYDRSYDTISCNSTTMPQFQFSGIWLPHGMKQIYKHILIRESRNEIPVYLTGFSAGGQVVTRYMFVRQFYPDSIPIKMAVSVSPAAYLFPTDTFNSMFLGTPCGLGLNAMNYYGDCISGINDTVNLRFICDDHIFQYYNENYGVLVGEADSAYYSICVEQGDSRLERARNFFAFCDTNALSLGTTLKWPYAEVPGIGHNDSLMYHTCAAGDSIPIAERMLFETPWHPVPDSALVVDFKASTLRPKLSTGVVQFTNNTLNGISYLWDFGDSTYSSQVNPQHTYLSPDTFSVKLTATSLTGCSYTLRKKYYIIVLDDTGIDENEPYATIRLFPNPAEKTLQFELPHTESVKFYISDITGRILQKGITENEYIDISSLASGYYILILQTEDRWYRGQFVKE